MGPHEIIVKQGRSHGSCQRPEWPKWPKHRARKGSDEANSPTPASATQDGIPGPPTRGFVWNPSQDRVRPDLPDGR